VHHFIGKLFMFKFQFVSVNRLEEKVCIQLRAGQLLRRTSVHSRILEPRDFLEKYRRALTWNCRRREHPA
jgi:hypothetical protein